MTALIRTSNKLWGWFSLSTAFHHWFEQSWMVCYSVVWFMMFWFCSFQLLWTSFFTVLTNFINHHFCQISGKSLLTLHPYSLQCNLIALLYLQDSGILTVFDITVTCGILRCIHAGFVWEVFIMLLSMSHRYHSTSVLLFYVEPMTWSKIDLWKCTNSVI